jgi:predicted lactoylglutathione lyase
MRSKISFITIAVTDLKKSVDFYKNGFGFPTKGIQDGNEEHCLFDLDNKFSLVLYRRQDFLPLTANPNQKEKSAGFMLSHNAQSKEQVKEILHSALKAGATQIGQTQDEPWGYSASITDPDGHQWEIVYMPHYDNN